MSGRVEGKKALVTGAAGGLGEAIAKMLAREGASVALTDIDEAGARRLAETINAGQAGRAFAYAHDVTSEDAWKTVLERANADLGGLSVLVHNAGIGGALTAIKVDGGLSAQ